MTKTYVPIETVVYGDIVEVQGHVYIVNSISDPDANHTCDLYLKDEAGVQHHKVVSEGVDLLHD